MTDVEDWKVQFYKNFTHIEETRYEWTEPVFNEGVLPEKVINFIDQLLKQSLEEVIGPDIELGDAAASATWMKNVGHNAEKILARQRASSLLGEDK